jgi:hypothetical protein
MDVHDSANCFISLIVTKYIELKRRSFQSIQSMPKLAFGDIWQPL